MPGPGALPRKRRTRDHVIADLSVNHVERFILAEGHVVQRVERDYGYDLFLTTFDELGYVEAGYSLLQLKASEKMEEVVGHYPCDVDIRDYNLWMIEPMPVVLILFDVPRERGYWLDVQAYFLADPSKSPRKGARTVRVHVPCGQRFNRRAVVRLRAAKQEAVARRK